jgi:hypothetical protein
MKNLNKLVILAFAGALAFTGCKKGAEDPGISLRSRDSRLEGDWTLSSIDGTATISTTSTNNLATSNSTTTTTINTTTSYSGGSETIAINYNSQYSPSTGTSTTTTTKSTTITPITYEIKLEKSGDATITTTSGMTTKSTVQQNSTPVVAPYTGETNSIRTLGQDAEGNAVLGLAYDGNFNSMPVGQTNTSKNVSASHWKYNGDKKEVIEIDGLGTFEILRLANKELKLKKISNGAENDASSSTSGTPAVSTSGTSDSKTTIDETWDFKQ